MNSDESQPPYYGRLIKREGSEWTLLTKQGHVRFSVTSGDGKTGDWVQVKAGQATVLTPNLTPDRTLKWSEKILNPRRLHGTRVRAQVENQIRKYFLKQDFLETRTPLLVPSPGMEPHIKVWKATSTSDRSAYLPTSPEFAMKKLLAGGLEKIFQISPAFRDEPHSNTHSPEFTMLEWYRTLASYEDLMSDVENLFIHLAQKLFGKSEITHQGQVIDLTPPWPRFKVRDLFLKELGLDLGHTNRDTLAKECEKRGHRTSQQESWQENWDDLYFKLWLNEIEPKLPRNRPCIVMRYPESQAALSKVDKDLDGTKWARRFEVYIGGFELGNAFEELTDPIEQRKRFEVDMTHREKVYGSEFPKSPIDEEFLHALMEGIPPTSGIAMGVDRIVMLFANETNINYTFWLPSIS